MTALETFQWAIKIPSAGAISKQIAPLERPHQTLNIR